MPWVMRRSMTGLRFGGSMALVSVDSQSISSGLPAKATNCSLSALTSRCSHLSPSSWAFSLAANFSVKEKRRGSRVFNCWLTSRTMSSCIHRQNCS